MYETSLPHDLPSSPPKKQRKKRIGKPTSIYFTYDPRIFNKMKINYFSGTEISNINLRNEGISCATLKSKNKKKNS